MHISLVRVDAEEKKRRTSEKGTYSGVGFVVGC